MEAIKLSSIEARVIACLAEKEETTPDYYPMTLNGLMLACNQKSNRHPVVNYDEAEVGQAVDALRDKKWVMRVDFAGSRVPKYKHRIEENLQLTKPEKVLLTVLMLRGAQTLGELKVRSERMYKFAELLDVEKTLMAINTANEYEIVKVLSPKPGQKEKRYIQTFSEFVEGDDESDSVNDEFRDEPSSAETKTSLAQRVSQLENELQALKEEFKAFRDQFR